jgi:hypothetical protein
MDGAAQPVGVERRVVEVLSRASAHARASTATEQARRDTP